MWYRSIWRWWRGRGKFFGWWIAGLNWRPPMILHYMRLLYVHGQVLSVMRIIPMLLTKEREILVEDGLIWKCIVCIIASLVINYEAREKAGRLPSVTSNARNCIFSADVLLVELRSSKADKMHVGFVRFFAQSNRYYLGQENSREKYDAHSTQGHSGWKQPKNSSKDPEKVFWTLWTKNCQNLKKKIHFINYI